ncbi:MAG: hypothetical protein HOA61_06130 [Bacteroidetes bacterium]|jgi:hypothetical protein|nr:hypothetical protein [Bacteroidota bacterium]
MKKRLLFFIIPLIALFTSCGPEFPEPEEFPFDVVKDSTFMLGNLECNVKSIGIHYPDEVCIINEEQSAILDDSAIYLFVHSEQSKVRVYKSDILLTSVSFHYQNLGFVSGYRYAIKNGKHVFTSVILSSKDQGLSWTEIASFKDMIYRKIYFLSADVGFIIHTIGSFSVGTSTKYISKSVDGGHNWKVIDSINNCNWVEDIKFSDSMNGYIFGHYYRTNSELNRFVIRTNDAGDTWMKVLNKPHIYDYQIVANNIEYYSDGAFIYRSTDNGKSWKSEPKKGNLYFFDKDFALLTNRYCINWSCWGADCVTNIELTKDAFLNSDTFNGYKYFPAFFECWKTFGTRKIGLSKTHVVYIDSK